MLSDPEKRQTYDRYGLKGLQEGADSGHDDIFSRVFGGFFGGGGGGGMGGMRQRRSACEDKILQQPVSLEDLYNGGKTIPVEFNRIVLCGKCEGRGGKAGAARHCNSCGGSGNKISLQQVGIGIVRQVHTRCQDCNGKGEVYSEKDRCTDCRGNRTKEELKTLEVHIDKGMKNMHKMLFRDEGDQIPDSDKGNVIVVLCQTAHEFYQRSGNDLVITHQINLTEALCGFDLPIQHLDGRELVLKCPPGDVIRKDSVKAIKGEGMPIHKNPFEKGNLYVQFEITFPNDHFATAEQMKQLESLLPPRPPFVMPIGDDVEEVDMQSYDPRRSEEHMRGEAYDSDEEQQGHGNDVQCQTQ